MTEQQTEEGLPPVWGGTIDDGRFEARVDRDEENPGHEAVLVVKVVESGEELVREKVGLAFGAVFGPDISDVEQWVEKSIGAINGWLTAHGEPIPEEGEKGDSTEG